MSQRRDWLAGCVAGVWTGFLLVYGFIVGAVLFMGFAIAAARARSLIAFGGMLLGSGGILLLILGLADANCAGNFGQRDGACTPPDLSGLLIAGFVLASAGIVLTIHAMRVARSR
jgi:hypothetical protein